MKLIFFSKIIGSLVNAGTTLAQTPFGEENNENVIAEEKQHNSDLLISRIQSEVNVVVDNVWKELNDKVFSRTFVLLKLIFPKPFLSPEVTSLKRNTHIIFLLKNYIKNNKIIFPLTEKKNFFRCHMSFVIHIIKMSLKIISNFNLLCFRENLPYYKLKEFPRPFYKCFNCFRVTFFPWNRN